MVALDHALLRAVQASTLHMAILDVGYGRHEVVALSSIEKDNPSFTGISGFVLQDLTGRGSESMPYGWGPLLRKPADFSARAVPLDASGA